MRATTITTTIIRGRLAVAILLSLVLLAVHPKWRPHNPDRYAATAPKKESTTVSSSSSAATSSSNIFQIAPGELPGYTGWARPEYTLAGRFVIQQSSPDVVVAGQDWVVTVRCQDCPTNNANATTSWFYVRAYGPSIVTGLVEALEDDHDHTKQQGGGLYRITVRPVDPGVYTVELVLTYSAVPPLDQFPVRAQQQPTSSAQSNDYYYEGYLLNGFPRQVTVTGHAPPPRPSRYCLPKDLVLSTTTTTLEQQQQAYYAARWRVVDSVRSAAHALVTTTPAARTAVSWSGYQQSYNSLGIRLQYERTDDCTTVLPNYASRIQQCLTAPSSSFANSKSKSGNIINNNNNNHNNNINITNNNQSSSSVLHYILIGDSTMRLQKQVLESWLEPFLPTGLVKITFYELYGGTLRCERLSGPKVSEIAASLSKNNNNNERRVVLFNTGLHDIHRLCGSEWQQDRWQYLTPRELSLPCGTVYRQALQILFQAVQAIPAVELLLFQTTTAAWPKYGNYGVAWSPRHGQSLPLDAGFIAHFNEIALDMIRQQPQPLPGAPNKTTALQVVDGYWITLPRPDHREIDGQATMGKKLSHPGPEVVLAMVRIWSSIFLQTVCGPL